MECCNSVVAWLLHHPTCHAAFEPTKILTWWVLPILGLIGMHAPIYSVTAASQPTWQTPVVYLACKIEYAIVIGMTCLAAARISSKMRHWPFSSQPLHGWEWWQGQSCHIAYEISLGATYFACQGLLATGNSCLHWRCDLFCDSLTCNRFWFCGLQCQLPVESALTISISFACRKNMWTAK